MTPKEKELLCLQKMNKSKEILNKLAGATEIALNPPLDLSEVGKVYLVTRITIEPGQHIIGHFDFGRRMLSINNCALWQMDRVVRRLEERHESSSCAQRLLRNPSQLL